MKYELNANQGEPVDRVSTLAAMIQEAHEQQMAELVRIGKGVTCLVETSSILLEALAIGLKIPVQTDPDSGEVRADDILGGLARGMSAVFSEAEISEMELFKKSSQKQNEMEEDK